MKIFNCEPGTVYAMPLNVQDKHMIKLRIIENLGHNSIRTECLHCHTIDTYAKDELESAMVYMCKHCGKENVYENGYCRLSIIKIKDRNTVPKAVCRCLDCRRVEEYLLDDLMNGLVKKCKYCVGGLYVGKRLGRVEVVGFSQTGKGAAVKFRCLDCHADAGIFLLKSTIQFIRSGKDISSQCKCKCTAKLNNTIQQKKQNSSAIKLPKETDLYKDIKPCNTRPYNVYAECKNCGVVKEYNKQDVIDNEPCDICGGYEIDDVIAQKIITDADLSRLKISEYGNNHVVKMKKKYSLNVSNTKLIKQEFDKARENKEKYNKQIYCKCNNCSITDGYSLDDINDVKACNACDFNILIGSIVGSQKLLTEQIIEKIRVDGKVTYINTKCTTCGASIITPKVNYTRLGPEKCPVCSFKVKNRDNIKSVIGNIFGVQGTSVVNNYIKIGKYIILDKTLREGRYVIKAQCSECGMIITREYVEKDGFEDEFSNFKCSGCDSLLSETRNYINNNNWVGYIKNCRVVTDVFTEDHIKKADIKCLFCGDIIRVPLTVFLYSDYCVCEKCMDRKVIVRCPSCNQIHDNDITLADLYSSEKSDSKIICPVNKVKNHISAFRLYHEQQSKLDFLIKNYSDLGNIERVPGGSLIKSLDKYYVGTDGKNYYTCYCEEHNKFMTLRQDEMNVYDHIYCSDTRMFGYL